jgi:hypothetical protein
LHRFSRRARVNALRILSVTTFVVAVIFALRSPFDEQHQRRLFVLSSDNVRDSFIVAGIFSLLAFDRSPLTSDTFMSGLPTVRLDLNDWSTTLLPILAWSVRRPS